MMRDKSAVPTWHLTRDSVSARRGDFTPRRAGSGPNSAELDNAIARQRTDRLAFARANVIATVSCELSWMPARVTQPTTRHLGVRKDGANTSNVPELLASINNTVCSDCDGDSLPQTPVVNAPSCLVDCAAQKCFVRVFVGNQ